MTECVVIVLVLECLCGIVFGIVMVGIGVVVFRVVLLFGRMLLCVIVLASRRVQVLGFVLVMRRFVD